MLSVLLARMPIKQAPCHEEAMNKTPEPRPLSAPTTYRFPRNVERLFDWAQIETRLRASRIFWLATSNPNGSPHVTPVWGVWVERAVYFDGLPTARWARNIAADARASMNLESGTQAVIMEGPVDDLETDEDLGAAIVDAWIAKYGDKVVPDPVGNGLFRLCPRKVKAWSESLHDGTAWTFQ